MDPETTLASRAAETGTELYDLLVTPENIGIVIAIPLLIGLFKKVLPEKIIKSKVAMRLLPGAPTFWACVAMWTPGLGPPSGVSIGRLSGVGALWECVPRVCGGGGGCAGGGVPLGAVPELS